MNATKLVSRDYYEIQYGELVFSKYLLKFFNQFINIFHITYSIKFDFLLCI